MVGVEGDFGSLLGGDVVAVGCHVSSCCYCGFCKVRSENLYSTRSSKHQQATDEMLDEVASGVG